MIPWARRETGFPALHLYRRIGVFAALASLALASCQNLQPVVGSGEEAEAKDEGPVQDRVLVRVESQPTGAIVRVNNIRRGVTPVDLRIDTNADGSVITDVTISADFSTNPRSVPGFNQRILTYPAGDMLPARLMFTTTTSGGQQTIDTRESGRAITLR